jgi:DNA-binding NarL/FixJ family response regulator
MGLVGSLEDLSLLDILQIVNVSRRTGVLKVRPAGGEACFVHFRGGGIQDIVGGGRSEGGFVQQFIAQGLLDEEEYREASAATGGDPAGIVKGLISMGALNQSLVEQAKRRELAVRLKELVQVGQGDFAFFLAEEGDDVGAVGSPPVFPLGSAVSPQNLLTEEIASFGVPPSPPPPSTLAPSPAEHPDPVLPEPEPRPPVQPRSEEPAGVPAHEPVSETAGEMPGEPDAEWISAPPRVQPVKAILLPTQTKSAPEVHQSISTVFQAGKNHITVVLAGDDSIFKNLLWQRLLPHFDYVERVLSLDDYLRLCGALLEKHRPFISLVDLLMPTQDGRGYLGGLEILEGSMSRYPQTKVILMNDLDDPRLLDMVQAKGAVAVLQKPELSRLRIDQLEESINDFAELVFKEVNLLLPPVEEEMASFLRELGAEQVGDGFRVRDQLTLLKGLMGELASPRESSEISLLVLRLAAEYFERAVLFLVKKDEIMGLGGFGETGDREMMMQKVKRVRIPVDAESVLGDAIRSKATVRRPEAEYNDIDRDFAEAMGVHPPPEMVVIPMVSRGRAIAILYADNAVSKQAVPDISGIEIFMAQAGLAMEKALLERQLTSLKKSIKEGPRE